MKPICSVRAITVTSLSDISDGLLHLSNGFQVIIAWYLGALLCVLRMIWWLLLRHLQDKKRCKRVHWSQNPERYRFLHTQRATMYLHSRWLSLDERQHVRKDKCQRPQKGVQIFLLGQAVSALSHSMSNKQNPYFINGLNVDKTKDDQRRPEPYCVRYILHIERDKRLCSKELTVTKDAQPQKSPCSMKLRMLFQWKEAIFLKKYPVCDKVFYPDVVLKRKKNPKTNAILTLWKIIP